MTRPAPRPPRPPPVIRTTVTHVQDPARYAVLVDVLRRLLAGELKR